MTTTTLSRRLTLHKQEGAIKNHLLEQHHMTLDREILNNNTSILYYNNDFYKLKLAESILIDKLKPSINIQQKLFNILPTKKYLLNNNNNNNNMPNITNNNATSATVNNNITTNNNDNNNNNNNNNNNK